MAGESIAVDDAKVEVRRRHEERFALKLTGGQFAARELMRGNTGETQPKDVPVPAPGPDESAVGG